MSPHNWYIKRSPFLPQIYGAYYNKSSGVKEWIFLFIINEGREEDFMREGGILYGKTFITLDAGRKPDEELETDTVHQGTGISFSG
jgi:hypothetical protein